MPRNGLRGAGMRRTGASICRKRRVVCSDEEDSGGSDAEDSRGSDERQPSKQRRASCSEDEESDLDGFVVNDSDATSSDDEETSSESEACTVSDEDDAEDADAYIRKEEMRAVYESNRLAQEPPGYVASPEHRTQLAGDELWKHILQTLHTKGGVERHGLVASDTEFGDRVVQRVAFGEANAWNKKMPTGYYERIFVPMVEELFCQKAYQPLPEGATMPCYAFMGWKLYACTTTSAQNADERSDNKAPVWCICCQNESRNLRRLQIMKHVSSGIYMLTGGDCAGHMRAASEIDIKAACHVTQEHNDAFFALLKIRA